MVSYDYPATLSSLQAIRKALTAQPLKPVLEKLEQENKTVTPAIEKPNKISFGEKMPTAIVESLLLIQEV